MKFASRQDAGRCLGRYLKEQGVRAELVLGLLRGGVVVAFEVARVLGLPLDVMPVRKIGHPLNREFAVGALAEPDVFVLDKNALTEAPADRAQLDAVIVEEASRLRDYSLKFRKALPFSLAGRIILLVDDGLATGSTAEAATLSAHAQKSKQIIIAVPVCSEGALTRLKKCADNILALDVDQNFGAVGQHYQTFTQTTDEEVAALLKSAAHRETAAASQINTSP